MTGPGRPRNLLEARAVRVGYDDTDVLAGLDLDIAPGAFLGVVGPSGSGKTTLLRLLLGKVRPRSGTVTRTPDLRVGYVPQLETVNWDFPVTVTECVLMARTDRGWPWTTRRERTELSEVLERLGIADLAHRHIRELSGGQQQRMFLARALQRDPHVMLLDEPTSGVDVATRHEMLHLLGDLNAAGTAIVLTTHDLNGVGAHVPELVALHGRVVRRGAPREVMTSAVLEETFGAPMEVLEHLDMPVVLDRAGLLDGAHSPHAPRTGSSSGRGA